MTPKQFQTALIAFKKTIGPKAHVGVFVIDDRRAEDGVLCASIYPRGITEGRGCWVYADEFPALFDAIKAKWTEIGDNYRAETIRKMALAIIDITAANGHCTDAALRQRFDGQEVAEFGPGAISEANTIADKGPFTIITLGGANGAPADVTTRVQ